MDDFSKGFMIRTLEVVEESAKGQRMVVRLELIASTIVPILLFLVFSFMGVPMYLTVLGPLVIIIGGLSATLFLQRIFCKQMGPIALYSNGLDFPAAWIDRLLKKSPFLPKNEVASMSMRELRNDSRFAHKPFVIYHVTDKKGKSYLAGIRNKTDVKAATEYASKEWGTKIESDAKAAAEPSQARKEGRARKIPVQQQGPPSYRLFCTSCGANLGSDFEYCPSCGSYQGVKTYAADKKSEE